MTPEDRLKAVVDTNIIISALMSPRGLPSRLLDAWQRRVFEAIMSQPLIDEPADVVARPYVQRSVKLPQADQERILDGLRAAASVVEPEVQLDVSRDPSDNRVLEAAAAGGAQYIVSGDRDLLDLSEFQGIRIVTPREFAVLLAIDEI